MHASGAEPPNPRVLVAICSYGEKHLAPLRRMIATYQSMSFDVDVVVLSEASKDLGPRVKVVVGLPSPDPWSLGFAHKNLFAANVDEYDLFIYSEDDVEISEATLRAFLRATEQLHADEIAGMFRYSTDATGEAWLNDFYGHYHWKPQTVARRGDYVIAEYTNLHSACYVVTRSQLKRAIDSGGFVRPPSEGVYDLLCTAATDPYTRCGFRKVLCVSAAKDFFVHHLPDLLYPDRSLLSAAMLNEQLATLHDIVEGKHPRSTLFDFEPRFWHSWWQKSYMELPSPELLSLIPQGTRTVLSIGTGYGAAERALADRGLTVTVLPLDSVVGALLDRRGFEVVYGSWKQALATLAGRKFDCVLMTDLLHLQRDPDELLAQCADLVDPRGALVLGGPNFSRLPWLIKRKLGRGQFAALRSFDQSGIMLCGPRSIRPALRRAGLQRSDILWLDHDIGAGPLRGARIALGELTARSWALRASS